MKGFREKCKKPPFLGILVKNDQFWTFFGQNGRNGFFFKKALGTFFPPLQALTAKFQKKVMNGFRDISGRTNGQMNERGLNSRFLRINIRRTKNDPNLAKKGHF